MALALPHCRPKALQALPAFPAVGFAPQPVHGNGQRLVGFLGNGPIRHGAGLKPLHNGIHALHLLQGNAALWVILKIKDAPQIHGPPLPVYGPGILFKGLIIPVSRGLLQKMDGQRVVKVLLLSRPLLVAPRAVQRQIHVKAQRVKSRRMKAGHIPRNILQGDAAHPAYGVGKIFVHHLLRNADGLKNLGALVGLNGRNPHFGRDLYNAVEHRAVIILHRCIIILVKHSRLDQVLDRFLGQIRVHRTGPVPQKGRKMVNLPGLPALQNQRHGGSFLGLYQMLLQSRHRQQRRDRHMVFVNIPVRQNNNVRPRPVRPVHLQKQPVNSFFQRSIFIVGNGNDLHLKARPFHVFDLQKIRAGENGIVHLENLAVLRLFLQNISVLPHKHSGAGDNGLPDRVNRRIGYLGKQLLKIVEQGLMFL